jgi:hypothetical protein
MVGLELPPSMRVTLNLGLLYESEPERSGGGAWVLTLQQHTGVEVAHTTLTTLILVAAETRQTRLGGSWKGGVDMGGGAGIRGSVQRGVKKCSLALFSPSRALSLPALLCLF